MDTLTAKRNGNEPEGVENPLLAEDYFVEEDAAEGDADSLGGKLPDLALPPLPADDAPAAAAPRLAPGAETYSRVLARRQLEAPPTEMVRDVSDTFADLEEAGLLEELVELAGEGEDTTSEDYIQDWGMGDLIPDDEEEESELAGFDLDEILAEAIDRGASDVHISADDNISFTIRKDIIRMDQLPTPGGRVTEKLVDEIISNVLADSFIVNLELDTSYVLRSGRHKGRRTRLSLGRSFGNIFLVFRVIADVIPGPEALGIGEELLSWTKLPNGLVMICGPTGTGKTTTFASMIREIQLRRAQKIITLEKPVEYVFGTTGRALVTQREIGYDARSFGEALTSAMRQAPDIIMVGEVRNHDEVSELLRAAESGHLALSTMHTNSCATTINRIRSLFEGDEQLRILSSLADNLRGLCNQVLVRSTDGKRVTAVREVLTINEELRSYVLEGNVPAIRDYQLRHKITMEHALVAAAHSGQCSLEEARSQSVNTDLFDHVLNGD